MPELRRARLVGLVADESNDHAVEVEEEHQQVETKLDERFLENVSGPNSEVDGRDPTFLWTFSFLKISVASSRWFFSKILSFVSEASSLSCHIDVLLAVPCQEGQVENKRDPVSVDEEQEGQESVNGGLRDDVGVQAVAEVDGVDVVTGAKLACARSQARRGQS